MRRKDREVTQKEELIEILDSCKTACIAMIDGDIPYNVPLNYGYEFKGDDLILFFHCAKEGRKIKKIKNSNRVCFALFSEGEPIHAETPCSSGYYYSSIIGNGTAQFVEDMDEKKHALKKLVEHQMQVETEFTDAQADTVCVFKVISKDYSGKRKPKM